MKVLLVYANQSRDLLPPPPVGLAYVAGAARRAGHEVELIDLLVARRPLARLGRAVRRFAPEVVGISVRNIDNVTAQRWRGHLEPVAEQIETIRAETDAPIVLGGPAVSILGVDVLRLLNADYAVVGEGEAGFARLLQELGEGRRFALVPGLCWRSGERLVANPVERRTSFGDARLDDWITWRRYETQGSTWPIQTKRGCTHRCVYCVYPTLEGAEHRLRPVDEVVDEIERVSRTVRPRTFEIVDSIFNLPLERAMKLCEEIVRRGLRVNLTATTINPVAVTDELFRLMKRAGFIGMMITPESACDATLQRLQKGFSKEHVRRAAELTARSGIPSAWFFLLGGPGETETTADETVTFIEERLADSSFLSIVTTGIRLLPGSELARVAAANGGAVGGDDLARPVFYLSPDVSERWLLERVNRAIRRRSNVVHTAEEAGTVLQGLYNRLLHAIGTAPPYWRFLPRLLALPPVHATRGRTLTF